MSSRPKKRTQLKEHKPMEQRAVGEPAEMGPTGLPRMQGNKIAGKITAKGETDQKNRNQMPEKGPGSKLTRLNKEKDDCNGKSKCFFVMQVCQSLLKV